ncbi:hypothetical protein [Nocardioides perillae]|uniref:Uncharacterized protein n=1 Tax=Nocardioides perillae TaxID=1119534 RepID=A0A7Y9RYC7_9ACTN|nr:hypothetical protein [Nocardioides perillae]NYG56364.1 hypothetical protein [Nocardioides perillae]
MSARRRLLLLGAVPSLLLLLVAARVLMLALDDERGRDAYAAGEVRDAVAHLARNRVAAPVEQWVAAFGEGTARAAASGSRGRTDPDELAGAEVALTDALALAPAEAQCRVRVNLALVVEARGDAAARGGQQGAGREEWTRARGVLAAGGCTQPGAAAPAVSRTARRADERVRAKLAASRAAEEAAAALPAATPQQRRDAARLADLAARAAGTEREVRDAQRPDPGEGVQW